MFGKANTIGSYFLIVGDGGGEVKEKTSKLPRFLARFLSGSHRTIFFFLNELITFPFFIGGKLSFSHSFATTKSQIATLHD